MKYQVCLNLGNENLNVDQKTITANEVVETVDEQALAREIAHENPLIPEQVAKSVLQNFCKAAAQLMSMGFAIQLKNGNDVALRIYPDIHVRGGNINLERAQGLDPTVTDLTVENAGALVDRVGVTVRARAECEQKFTDLLLSMGASVQRKEVVEKAKVLRKENQNGDTNAPTIPDGPSGNGGGNTNPGGGGDDEGDGNVN